LTVRQGKKVDGRKKIMQGSGNSDFIQDLLVKQDQADTKGCQRHGSPASRIN
jgi:hypothetical protein